MGVLPPEAVTPKVMIVLGPGRSCTSGVAKGLHDAGWPMGSDLLGPAPSNPWGHYEDRCLVRVNGLILSQSGGSWNEPPPTLDPDSHYFADQYVEERCEQAQGGQWGMKDPRLVLTWPIWQPALDAAPIDPIVVMVWRAPSEIAASLVRRDGMDPARALTLAGEYHERMTAIAGELT